MEYQSSTDLKTLTPTRENYLRALFQLSRGGDGVRLTDLARVQEVRLPTARSAVNHLRDFGMIQQENYGKITLTESGRKLGREICDRFEVTRQFLIEVLGVEEKTAEREACIMEHHLDQDTLNRIAAFVKHVLQCNNKNMQTTDCIVNLKSSLASPKIPLPVCE